MNALDHQIEGTVGVITIEAVEHVGDHKLKIRFADGKMNVVDFGPFLRCSHHPAIRAYLEAERFRGFTVEDGFLHWNDFDLVFPIADLYAGVIH